ncbi:hypothetical protein K7I13_05500 [Brucepastera parasyntrophica]|uniref:hypothetical protein n=1 Tax=Brucepastera parasyntrophica TaxID=2880008 RepID=UPI0021097602|nr:hypothetical protein [Brucepastera parasyntrophica]ULQ60726.1 hypothetical protein K7I13_05500 [Brucepastera parasyntrophica]
MKKVFIFCVSIVISFQGLYGQDRVRITSAEAGVSFRPEYNRSFQFCWDLQTYGRLTINDTVLLRGGVSLGQSDVFNANTFLHTGVHFPLKIALSAHFLYMYNTWPDYKTSIHSFLPFFLIQGKWIGGVLGFNTRKVLYEKELLQTESILLYGIYGFFYPSDSIKLILSIANFNDFLSGNIGSYTLGLICTARVSPLLSIIGQAEVFQTGSFGLASNFYGTAFKGGVIFHF